MNQVLAILYELRHEMSLKNVVQKYAVPALMMAFVLFIIPKGFFSDYSSTKSSIFTISIALFWIGIFNSITAICSIRPQIKAQVVQGVRISSFVFANSLFQLLQCIIQSLIITVVFEVFVLFNRIKNCPTDGIITLFFIEFFLFSFFSIFASDMLGLAISSISKSEKSAMTLMPFVLIAEMVLSNALFQLPKIGSWLSFGMISRWSIDIFGSICNITSIPSSIPQNVLEMIPELDTRPTELPDIMFSTEMLSVAKSVLALVIISMINLLATGILLNHIKKERLL